MTPQFITPCYVRVEDADKRKEVVLKAVEIGLLPINIAECIDSNYLFAFDGWISRLYGKGLRGEQGEKELELAGFIDCGTNTELFLVLAGMRSDSDKGQWFIDERDGSINFSEDDDIGLSALVYRKATATEIINHHKQKGE